MEQVIFNWVVAACGFMGGWILKVVWGAINDLKTDLKSLDKKMHEDFVRRDDFKEAMSDMKTDMREGFKEVKEMIGQVFDRLNNKQDKE